jgi:hypothetical protein
MGTAESFVNTFKHDYVSRMHCSTAARMLEQLPAAFDISMAHPHSGLK